MNTFLNSSKLCPNLDSMIERKRTSILEYGVMSFNEAFLKLRREKGWTQVQVAESLGISVGQIKKYEKGDSTPSLGILGKIAALFGVSADVFVFEAGKGIAGEKLDAELLRRFECISKLPEREKDAVMVVLDSIIAKQRLREVIEA